MASGGRILLVAVEHDGFGQKKGPPFQVLCSGYKTQGTHGMIAEVLVQMVVKCRLRVIGLRVEIKVAEADVLGP